MNKVEATSNFPTIVINSTTPRVSKDENNSDSAEKHISSQHQPNQIAINMNEITAATATESIQKSTQSLEEKQQHNANSAQNTPSTSTSAPSLQPINASTYQPNNNEIS